METLPSILAGLLLFCNLSAGQHMECNRTLFEDVEFQATNIISLQSPDVAHCQQMCTQHASCLLFTFIRPDWTEDGGHFHCNLKSHFSGEPGIQTLGRKGVTSGFSLKECDPDGRPCLTQVYQNTDFMGGDYRALFTADHEECQRVCTQESDCQYFTFVNGLFTPKRIRYKCHLKSSWTVPTTPGLRREAGVVSGFSENVQFTKFFEPACQRKLFTDTEIPGHSVKSLAAISAEHCHALCSAHPRCTYFSYTGINFVCDLKNNPEELVTTGKDGVTSGLASHFCQLDKDWLRVTHEGVNIQGSDIRQELQHDLDTCRSTCAADPDCQFYSYFHETHSDTADRRRCNLKRVIGIPAPTAVNTLQNVVSGFALKSWYCF